MGETGGGVNLLFLSSEKERERLWASPDNIQSEFQKVKKKKK
jgi:hypothetical protein